MNTYLRFAPLLLFYAVVAQASEDTVDLWLNQSRWENMPAEQERQFLAEWKLSLRKGLVTGPGAMFNQILTTGGSTDMFPRLRFNNPPIAQVVVKLYFQEVQFQLEMDIAAGKRELESPVLPEERREFVRTLTSKHEKRLAQLIEEQGYLLIDVGKDDPLRSAGESGMDYQDQLGCLALSTLEPKLYQSVWTSRFGFPEATTAYLGRVNCEESLLRLFNSVSQEGENNFDQLYSASYETSISVWEAFAIIQEIVHSRLDLGMKYHENIMDLVRKYRTIYWREKDAAFASLYAYQSYYLRKAMIVITSALGTVEDIEVLHLLDRDVAPGQVMGKTLFRSHLIYIPLDDLVRDAETTIRQRASQP